MKKFIYVLFMTFLLISCGESHHQVTGSVDYCFEGDSITNTIHFQKDYYFNGWCKDQGYQAVISVSENGSELDLYIVGRTAYALQDYFGPYNLVTAPGKRITYSNLNYKYTVEIK
jgi:hypothetical protein